MMFRLLAIAIVIAAVAVLPGCKKQEPATPADTAQQVKENASSAVEEQKEKADEMEQETQEDIAAEE